MTPQPRPPLVGFGARLGATLLDLLIVWALLLVLVAFAAAASVRVDFGGWMLLYLIVGGIYCAATMTRKGARNGQTIGKEAANIRVVRNDGRPVTLKTVALREGLMKLVAGNVTFGVFPLVDAL